MIDADNIIDAVVYNRFYKFKTDKVQWLVFESLSEEGPDVKKKVGSFSTENQADEFINKMIEALKTFLTLTLNITKAASDQPIKYPLAKDVLKSIPKEPFS